MLLLSLPECADLNTCFFLCFVVCFVLLECPGTDIGVVDVAAAGACQSVRVLMLVLCLLVVFVFFCVAGVSRFKYWCC